MKNINLLVLFISLIIFGCENRKQSETKVLIITSGFNEQKRIYKYCFNDGKIFKVDTLNFKDLNKNIRFDSRFPNVVVDNVIFTPFGVPLNINDNKIIYSDSSGHQIINRGFLLKAEKENLFFYNFNCKCIVKFNLKRNELSKIKSLLKIELPYFNQFPYIDCISSDLKKQIKISTQKDFENKNTLNLAHDIILKNLVTGDEKKIINSVHGTVMSKLSSTFSIPALKWINENEFIFTDYKTKDTLADCGIKKYNVLDNSITNLGTISSIPLANQNNSFEFDVDKNLFFKTQNKIFLIDFKENKISKNAKYSLGNNFSAQKVDGLIAIYHNNEEIYKESHHENFDLTTVNYKSINNYLVISINRKIKNSINNNSVKIYKVWSEKTKNWIEIKNPELTSITGWK